jgi:hypothetical protein
MSTVHNGQRYRSSLRTVARSVRYKRVCGGRGTQQMRPMCCVRPFSVTHPLMYGPRAAPASRASHGIHSSRRARWRRPATGMRR